MIIIIYRFSKYRGRYRKDGATSKLFKHFGKHGTNVFKVRLLEEFEGETETEKREYLRRLNPSLNQKTCMNDEERRQHGKLYKETNRETIRVQRSVKYTCGCGSGLTRDSKSRHNRTKKHMDYVEKTNYSTGNERSE